jgi:hypothetical protein
MERPKLNLTLLKKLVGELELAAQVAEKTREGKKPHEDEAAYNDFVVEMGKVSGLCSSVAVEASALVKDCAKILQYALVPDRNPNDFALSDLLGGYMPSGDNGGGKLGN